MIDVCGLFLSHNSGPSWFSDNGVEQALKELNI